MKKFRICSKLIFLTSIVLIILIGCEAEQSGSENSLQITRKSDNKYGEIFILRRKRTMKFEDLPLNMRKRLLDDLDTIFDNEEDDDVQGITIVKRETVVENVEKDSLDNNRAKRNEKGKRKGREIFDLKKRSEIPEQELAFFRDDFKRQINDSIIPLTSFHSRFIKIEVDTPDIDQETAKKGSSQNKENEESKKKYASDDRGVQRCQTSDLIDDDTRNHETGIEQLIQKRIDSIKEQVKRELEEKIIIQEIEMNNSKFDQVQAFTEKESIDDSKLENKKKRSEPDYVDQYEALRRKRKAKLGQYKKPMLISKRSRVKIENELPANLDIDPIHGFSEANGIIGRSKDDGSHVRRTSRPAKFNRTKNQSFLFPGRVQPQLRLSSDHKRLTKSSKNWGKSAEHNQKKQNERFERAADEPLDDAESDSVVESNQLVDVALCQDISSQLLPEYQEAFGGLPSNAGAVLERYKRIKKDKA